MAIIEQGILGGFRGKVGNVIGYVRNGVWCMRSMPTHYHDRRSAAQLKNRSRFTLVMKAMSAVKPAITLGFRRFAEHMTEMNVATRENYYRLVRDSGSGMVYAYDGLLLSRGPVERLSGVMKSLSGRDLSLAWNGADVPGGGDDLATVVIVNAERMETKMWRAAAQRRSGHVTVTMPVGWESEETYCYVMMERDGEWSDSEYVGRLDAGLLQMAEEMAENEDGMRFDMPTKKDLTTIDQSAIKVLSDLGQVRVEKGVEMPPGGEKTRRRTDE